MVRLTTDVAQCAHSLVSHRQLPSVMIRPNRVTHTESLRVPRDILTTWYAPDIPGAKPRGSKRIVSGDIWSVTRCSYMSSGTPTVSYCVPISSRTCTTFPVFTNRVGRPL